MSDILVATQRGNSFWGLEFKKKRKGQFSCSRVKSFNPEELSGRQNVTVVADIQPFHYARERVTKGPPEAIRIQLVERVERIGIFRNSPEIFYKPETERGMYVECSICAVDPDQRDLLLDQLIKYRIGPRSLFHTAIATSAFVLDQVPNESVIAVHGDEKSGWIIITDSAGIRYLRSIKFDEFLGLSDVAIKEEIDLAAGQYRRMTGLDVTKTLVFGSIRGLIPEADSPSRLKWCPDANEEDIAQYPELFGALLVPAEFMMLPKLWVSWNKHLSWAKKVAVGMTILAVTNGALAGYFFRKEQQIKTSTTVKAQIIRTKSEELTKKIPFEKLKLVDAYKNSLEAFKREPKMDEFIAWLVNTIPSDFKITHMSIKKSLPQPGSAPTPQITPSPATTSGGESGSFSVTISLGAITNFEEAHRVFQNILEAVHSRYSVSKSGFRFNDRENTTECNFELKL